LPKAASEWISAIALFVSLISLGLTIFVARWNIRLAKAQRRTDILTKLVDLRLQYSQFNRRIQNLRGNPRAQSFEPLRKLVEAQPKFHEFEQMTEGYRRALLDPSKNLDAVSVENLRHPVEALLMQLAADNKRLDELLESNSTLEAGAPQAARCST